MNSAPRVSAVIALRNGERYIAETLASILDQTHPPDEVIVVDDGSTDTGAALARSFGPRVTVIGRDHAGAGASRNAALAAASGEILAFCDADDLWLPEKTERQLALVPDPTLPVAVFCGFEEFISPEVDPGHYKGRPPAAPAPGARIISSLVLTRSALDAVGPFDTTLGSGEWVQWGVRLSGAGVVQRHVEGVLVRRRLHLTNTSLVPSAERASVILEALGAHLRRGRGQGA